MTSISNKRANLHNCGKNLRKTVRDEDANVDVEFSDESASEADLSVDVRGVSVCCYGDDTHERRGQAVDTFWRNIARADQEKEKAFQNGDFFSDVSPVHL